jgi:metal-sulfur cluster biosynthetic enzyme
MANDLRILMTLTHSSCPMGGVVMEQAEAEMAAIANPDCATRTELTFGPPWTLDCIAVEGRRQLSKSG